jgi:hypothetical protein
MMPSRQSRLALATAAPLVYVGFSAGGYGPGATSLVAVVLALFLALRVVFAPDTVRRPGAGGGLAVVGIVGMAGWTLISGTWSGAPGRAMFDADRLLLYALFVAHLGMLPARARPAVVRGVLLAVVVIVGAGLATKLVPDLLKIDPGPAPDRLSWPVGYWNAYGLLAAVGLVLTLHHASLPDEPAWLRVGCTAAWPALACALYLTNSRGAIGVALLGIPLYLGLARPRAAVSVLAAAALPTLVATAVAWREVALLTFRATHAELVVAGHRLGMVLAVAMIGAVSAARLLLREGSSSDRLHLPAAVRRYPPRRVAVTSGAVAVIAFVAAGFPQRLYDGFLASSAVATGDPRNRLLEVYNHGRIDQWRVALDASAAERWRGMGAGMFAVKWTQSRPIASPAAETHSLYVETFAELGIPGAVSLTLLLLGLFVAPVLQHPRARAVSAAALACGAMWAIHAAVEWDWELPVVTLPALALLSLATLPARQTPWFAGRSIVTALVVAACAAASVLPLRSAGYAWRLSSAFAAYDARNCSTAMQRARAADRWLRWRPEPHAVQALCLARLNHRTHALAAAERAISADPENWEYRYVGTLVDGSTGGTPWLRLRDTQRLDPQSPVVAGFLAVSEAGSTDEDVSRRGYPWINGVAHQPIGHSAAFG